MPYKNIEDKKRSDREYRLSHKEERNEKERIWRDENRVKFNLYQKNFQRIYRNRKPWLKIYYAAKCRCNKVDDRNFKYYGGKGVKFLLTKSEIEFIWLRDNASGMKRPSIDRIDSNGNYEFSNCRFIELSENSRRGSINRWNLLKKCA